ncbi:ribonuclease H-like protein [Amniculicola lignicola CBS 123094]|uniref:poly(A)-specific ribonuclease n=1 Tax=Amniculicola lignicola CBS 123094 TaxID=1392246 RepID=A0A6A5WTN8_9PLEO|nr:ribonuclease H-like protein [Amniculicola lignicola CBS 123094]
MPPPGGRFPGANLSNPFAHLPNHPMHQQPHIPQQHQQNLPHPGFAGGNPGHNLNLFGQNHSSFQTNSGLGGAIGGAGLGGAAGLAGVGGGTGLDGHDARMRFTHAGQLQQDGAVRGDQNGPKGANQRIREVWRSNLHQEMDVLRALIDEYPYISMVSVVARPIGEFLSKASYHYQTVRCNVDLLKIIQLGVTLFNKDGQVPPPHFDVTTLSYQPKALQRYANDMTNLPCTWTFNFQFSLENDMYNEESIQLLKKSGADLEKHTTQGIDPREFGSLLITSGMTLTDDVHWISFHSGYDFAYLIKMLTSQQLPENEETYRDLVHVFFPRLLDVKFLWRHANSMVRRGILGSQATSILNNLGTKSGLQDLADELACQRVGASHTAGSDAWLTGTVFWELRKKIFGEEVPTELNGQMWGLTGVGPPASATAQAAVLAAQGQGQQMGYAQQPGMNGMMWGHREGPSTPTTHAVGLASTPGPSGQGGHGMMTPGTGQFGEFRYGGK